MYDCSTLADVCKFFFPFDGKRFLNGQNDCVTLKRDHQRELQLSFYTSQLWNIYF